MGFNRNKFVQDIRLIVGIDPNQSTLPAADPLPNIGSFRGVALVTPDHTNSSSVSTTPDNAQAIDEAITMWEWEYNNPIFGYDSNQGNQSDASDPYSDTNSEGSAINPKKPTDSIYSGDQGTKPAKDIIDNAPGTPVPPSNTQQGLEQGPRQDGGTLNGMNGMRDSATGKDLEVRFDGLSKPPAGWYNANTPALDPTDPTLGYLDWTMGTQWFAPGHLTYFNFPLDAAEYGRDIAGDGDKTDLISHSYNTGGGFWQFVFQNPMTMATATYQANPHNCTPSSSDPVCPISNPIHWPSDGITQVLRNSDGTLTITPYENADDVVPSLTDGIHSRLDFLFDIGDRKGSIIPAINGGYMITETDTLGGNPIGTVRLFGADNKMITYLDSTNYANYLPK